MSDLESDFQKLVAEVTTNLRTNNRTLQVQEYGKRPKQKYSFKAPKTFAWVTKKQRLDCLAVGTKLEWADTAGISDYDYKPYSQFNKPGAHWRIPEGDIDSMKNVARYLAQICEARHSD